MKEMAGLPIKWSRFRYRGIFEERLSCDKSPKSFHLLSSGLLLGILANLNKAVQLRGLGTPNSDSTLRTPDGG